MKLHHLRQAITKLGTSVLAISLLTLSFGSSVFAAGPPSYSISGSSSVSNLNVTLTGTASATNPAANGANHAISVNWDSANSNTWELVTNLTPDGNGNIPSTAWNAAHTYGAAGTYTIKVIIHHSNVQGNESGSQTFQSTVTVTAPTQCNDGTDNDSDGLTDLSDPGCTNGSDNDESNPIITASAGANGSISPNGSVGVASGSNQAFTITADSGYQISQILVDALSVPLSGIYTFTNVTANHTIAASFSVLPPNSHTIAASVNGGNGSISPAGSVVVTDGGSQAFTFTPDAGYQVDQILVDGNPVATTSPYTFSNVTADHTIVASFTAVTYTITASAGAGGSITPSGAVSVNGNANQSFTVTADSGFAIDQVLVDGNPAVLTLGAYEFTNVSSDHTISVTFSVVVNPTEDTLPLCTDGVDNDNDNDTDLDDQDCAQFVPTLTVVKTVTNDNTGTKVVSDFSLFIDGGPVSSGVAATVAVGAHTVSETPDSGYTGTIGGDCDANGNVTLVAGDDKTCTIVNDDIAPTNNGGGGGGGNFSPGNSDDDGEVLGNSTDGEVLGNTCPLITDYMRAGMSNSRTQVLALQAFLSEHLGIDIPASGEFDTLTTLAVNIFQLKYQPEVLKPWGELGYSPTTPTGYVFKTTKWKINDIACPDLDEAFPSLP